jgi:hypothetical protein
MLDIETLGTEPGCVILSVGACVFGRDGVEETWSMSVDLESCEAHGLEADLSTLAWWLSRSDEAQAAALEGGEPLEDVLREVTQWYREQNADQLWANSPIFDVAILNEACDRAGIGSPWSFWQLRDYRTLSDLAIADDIGREGTAHDALDDAVHQARVASATLRRLSEVELDA